jgi:Xaa-Pro aminopeptidase
MTSSWEPDLQSCRARQQRLLAEMRRQGVGLVVLTRPESVQWLTGARVGPLFAIAATMDSDGQVTLVLPSRKIDTPAAADSKHSYQEKLLSTMRDASDQQAACVAALLDSIRPTAGRAACEFSDASLLLTSMRTEPWIDFDARMFALRRKKDADELRMLRRANEANRTSTRAASSSRG